MDDAAEPDSSSLEAAYDAYERIEEDFLEALDASLDPRGPEMLYDIVAELGLPAGARVVDLGCGPGRHTVRLAKRFGFDVVGVDPVRRHLDLGGEELAASIERDPGLAERVRFERGTAESIPAEDRSVDLIWCRDVLSLVAALDKAYAECRRVLRDDGRMIVYQMFRTDLLEPREAERLWPPMGCVPASMEVKNTEAAISGAGFRIDRCIVLGTEWGEFAEEQTGKGARQLIHAARLLRDPDRYIARFGRTAYDIMVGDCLWHVYRLIGKLSDRIYVLSVVR